MVYSSDCFENLPNLQFVCVDDFEQADVQFALTYAGNYWGTNPNAICTSICNLKNNVFGTQKFSFSPNPVIDFINFNTKEQIIKLEVYDTLGRIIFINEPIDNKSNLKDLQSGKYIAKIYTQNDVQNFKIIKE